MDSKVILDGKSFKALSAESRVSILKRLNERRMTLSELSKKLGLRGSTIKEHCTILVNAELISKIDEGRKWKYYELTGKGKQIIAPSFMEEARVLVSLCIGAIIIGGLFLFLLQGTMMMGASQNFANENDIYAIGGEKVLSVGDTQLTTGASSETTTDNTPDSETTKSDSNYATQPIAPPPIALALIGMLVAGIIIGWVARKRL